MKIKKLELKNGYKRFHHLTIDLGETPARIVALVGPNGCGKSSVLDGMLYLSNTYNRIGNQKPKDYTYHSMHGDATYNYQSVAIDFDGEDFSAARKRREIAGKANTVFSFRSCYRYNSNVKISEVRATAAIAQNNYGATTSIDLDEKMEENYRRLHANYNRYLEESDSKPSEAKAKIVGDLNTSLKKCLDLEVQSLGNIEAGKGTLYFKKSDHPKEFEFNLLSAGEKEAVDILLDLYLRQDDYDDSVFLIDEPELHINTAIQRKLLVEMNRLIGPNCQLWVATHSIGFLRALQEDLRGQCQVIDFKEGTRFGAEPVTLKPIAPSLKVWREIFATALDDLAGLVSPRQIIYCEGRAEPGKGGRERGLDADVLNTVFAQAYPDTQFVSSGGNTELDQRMAITVGIISKVLPTLEIYLLKDRDIASGKKATEVDRQRYLSNNAANHRVLKRWEIENYLFDREVLEAYCSAEGLAFDATAYATLVSNINDDDVKDEANRVKNICGIITSVDPERFKRNLAAVIRPEMAIYKELEDCIFNRG
ncbi:MAG: AAA family ATPase [Planctomycetaceae bacterium]|nr:AAA family ATPase [Planctomycetaceae bacterium]